MTLYLVVPLLLMAAVLQSSLVPHLSVWGVFPDLPMILVMSGGLLLGFREGATWGLIAGVALDLMSGAPMGAATLSCIAVGLLSGLARATSLPVRGLLPAIAAFGATIVYDLVFLAVVRVSGNAVTWAESLIRVILPSGLLNGLLAPLVYWAVGALNVRLSREQMG